MPLDVLLETLRLQGSRNACAGIALPNAESVGLHRAFGFLEVGIYHGAGYKEGRWVDVLWLERVLGPPMAPATPSEPLPPEPFRVTGRQPRFAASYIDA